MTNINLQVKKQYNNFHFVYSDNQEKQDEEGNRAFYTMLDFDLKGKRLLDIGCGNGMDLKILSEKGAQVFGIDPSDEFINEAKENNPAGIFKNALAEDLPFEDNQFDVVVSKYAMQTSFSVPKAMFEAARVLRPGGMLVMLTKHPMRQWIERVRDNGHGENYYKQTVVTSNIFDGRIVLKEPSHTLAEYFNAEFYKNFEVIDFKEGSDFPASEQVNGDIYPTFFVVKARRK